MVMYNSPKRPFPPVYYCCFESVANGVIPAATAASFTYSVFLNTLYRPWNVTPIQTSANNFPAFINYSAATLQPQGYSNLCNAITDTTEIYAPYNNYCVLASSIEFESRPVAIGDNHYVSIVPTLRPAPASQSGIPSTFQAGLPDPYEKKRFFGMNIDAKPLKSYMSVAKLSGYTKKQVEADISGEFSSPTNFHPIEYQLWNVQIQTCNNAVTTAGIGYICRVRWWARLTLQAGSGLDQA